MREEQTGKAERQEEIKPGEQDTKTAQELKAMLENQRRDRDRRYREAENLSPVPPVREDARRPPEHHGSYGSRIFVPARPYIGASGFLHTVFDRKAAGLDRLLECVVVGFGLVGIGAREPCERAIAGVAFA